MGHPVAQAGVEPDRKGGDLQLLQGKVVDEVLGSPGGDEPQGAARVGGPGTRVVGSVDARGA